MIYLPGFIYSLKMGFGENVIDICKLLVFLFCLFVVAGGGVLLVFSFLITFLDQKRNNCLKVTMTFVLSYLIKEMYILLKCEWFFKTKNNIFKEVRYVVETRPILSRQAQLIEDSECKISRVLRSQFTRLLPTTSFVTKSTKCNKRLQ